MRAVEQLEQLALIGHGRRTLLPGGMLRKTPDRQGRRGLLSGCELNI